MIEVKAPNAPPDGWRSRQAVFLAGSIEQGSARHWQAEVVKAFAGWDVVLFNPRREMWDASLPNTIDTPEFYEQVQWELKFLHMADYVLFNFEPGTISPISLLELGMCASRKNWETIVCCPEGYARKGNVDITCDWTFTKRVEELSQAVNWVKGRIRGHG